MGCGIFSKGVTSFLLHVLVVKGKNKPPYRGGGRGDGCPFLPPSPTVSQLGRLSGQCTEAGGLGPAGCLKEGCNTCHQAWEWKVDSLFRE